MGDNVEVGVYSLNKALKLAQELELDLVEISPNANPPVCKILEYKKFLYEQKKREKALKSKATKVIIKEIRFGPNTSRQRILPWTRHNNDQSTHLQIAHIEPLHFV